MPTAVEFIAKLGAVLVQLPAAPILVVDPNATGHIGGRSQRAHHPPANPANHHHPVLFEPNNDSGQIGTRTGLLPTVLHPQSPGTTGELLPAVRTESSLIGLLRTALPQITQALPAVQKQLDVYGVNTSPGIIAILIGLLHEHGFQATLRSCDGSVRPGFSGPTAIIHPVGGNIPPNQFVHQVGLAKLGH